MKRIKLLYIGDLIMEIEDKLFHGFFDIEKFIHKKCGDYGIESAEKDILNIVDKCNKKKDDQVQEG